jgi:hypothetical protein
MKNEKMAPRRSQEEMYKAGRCSGRKSRNYKMSKGAATPALYILYWGAVGVATVYLSRDYLQRSKPSAAPSKWPSPFGFDKDDDDVAFPTNGTKQHMCQRAAEKYSHHLNEVVPVPAPSLPHHDTSHCDLIC